MTAQARLACCPVNPPDQVIIRAEFAPLLSHIGFDAAWVFSNDKIVAWRKLADRENCMLDSAWPDGRPVRLHIKRYPIRWAGIAEDEARALGEMEKRHIPCTPLVAWGRAGDGRGFIITEDLAGFTPADKLIAGGEPFDRVLAATAELAARLHSAGLHHRDLYLCHFLVRIDGEKTDAALIDAARVGELPAWLRRRRWIVKDLAQFWYSMTQLPISKEQRSRWLAHYARASGIDSVESLRGSIEAKARRIAGHDAKVNRRDPSRNISIPKG